MLGSLVLVAMLSAARADLLVSSFNNGRVYRYNETNGASLGVFVQPNASGPSLPHGLAVGPDGNLYVASAGNDSVLRYNGTNGVFMDAFIPPALGGLDYPVWLEFRDRHLYVSSQLNDRVLRYNATNGAFVDTFVTNASGGLDGPSGMAFGPDGNLYVVGRYSNNVLRYSGTNGTFLNAFVPAGGGGLSQPFGVKFGPDGNLYVVSGNGNKVARFNGVTGASLGDFVPSPSGALGLPIDLAFGPDGNLYVASFSNSKVVRFNGVSGAYINDFVTSGSGGVSGPNFMLFRAVPGPLIAYDDFYLAPASTQVPPLLHGANTGTGWVGGWSQPNFSAATADGYRLATTAPPRFSNLCRMGSYVSGGYQSVGVVRSLDVPGAFADFAAPGTSPPVIGRSGKTLWMSVLLRKEQDTNDEVSVDLLDGNDASQPAARRVGVGYFGYRLGDTRAYWTLQVRNSANSAYYELNSGVPVVPGQSALLVLKMQFGEHNVFSLYVNPPALGGAEPLTPNSTHQTDSGGIEYKIRTVGFVGGNTPGQGAVDEIRFGDSFAAVTPTNGPPVPLNLTATSAASRVTLTWRPAAGAMSYTVRRGTTSGGPYEIVASGLAATNFTDFSVTNETAYFYVVSAVSGGLESDFSFEASATPSLTVRLVPQGAVWKYLDNGVDQGTAWRALDFNDSPWASGPAQLGYGDDDQATLIYYGPSPEKFITYYFRRPFTLLEPELVTNLYVRLLRDDGGVVYLNGAEVFRSNLPTNGPIAYTNLALYNVQSPEENTVFFTNTVSPTLLHPGTNVVAVEIHQVTPVSQDISFDLEIIAQQVPPPPRLWTSVTGGTLALTWPGNAADAALQSATNLHPPIAWSAVTNAPALTNGVLRLTLPLTNGMEFFRLSNQLP